MDLLLRAPVLLLALLSIGLNSQEQPAGALAVAREGAEGGLWDDLGEGLVTYPRGPAGVVALDDKDVHVSRRSGRGEHRTVKSASVEDLGGGNAPEVGDGPSSADPVANATSSSPAIDKSAYVKDELEHAEKLNKLYAAEHAGGIAVDHADALYTRLERKPHQRVERNKTAPIEIAGKSGVAPKCEVDGDQMVISSQAEAACLIKEPLLTDRTTPVEINFDLEFLRYPSE